MKILRNLLVFLFIASALYPQQLGVWKNYASLQKIRDAYVTDKGIWAVSQGGAFYFNFEDSSYTVLNKAEGLSNNSLSAITLDPQGKVWIGSENGSIDVYNPSTKSFKRILEIANTNRISKRINEIISKGDTIIVSTDFGVSLINSSTLSFYESCAKFGDFFSDAKVLSTFKGNVTYVATQYGVAVQKSSLANFSAPESWDTYPNSAFQLAGSINQILSYRDTIVAATDKGLYYFNGITWAPKLPAGPDSITSMVVRRDSLFLMAGDNQIVVYANGKTSTPYAFNNYRKFAQSSQQDKFYVITDNGMLDLGQGKYRGYIFPNGPRANTFANMSITKDGKIYVASGTDAADFGYYLLDGGIWYNYNIKNLPGILIGNNSVYTVYISPENNRYLGTWGNGLVKFSDKDTSIFNVRNSGMSGIPKNFDFLVISGINNDSKGNLWVVNHISANKQPLSRLSTDGTWTHIVNPLDASVIGAWGPLIIDNNDTKWFLISGDESLTGQYLYYYNEKPLYSSDINGWGKITTDDGLTTGSVKALALGRRGELWVGTSEGVSIIDDPSRPRANGIITTVYLLRSQNVNCIAVDALNQKWVGTDKGVFVLSSDGTNLINNYTVDNSPLPSNSITSIAIDNTSGTVYIGTDYGLASVSTNSVNPQENLSGMFAYPNPVIVEKNAPVTINISGLVRDSEIKVFTISGKMVNNFLSPGAGIATWDGRDTDGNIVPTGIYLIVAYDKEGNNVGTTKVALVKK